ncbi:SPOSA6832_00676, partial [Sporobolomyces salmonicolor]
MDSSLRWLIFWMSLLGISFIIYLFLSTCVGPPLIRALRQSLAAHHRRSAGDTWDGGDGSGYRDMSRRRGFMEGSGGAEGYEMAAMGED